jgi:hypothetical protein
MNITVLDKLEKGFVKFDWKRYINRYHLTTKQLEVLIDKIENFAENDTVSELVLFKLDSQPIYVTVTKDSYELLLDCITQRLLLTENYELCSRILLLKTKL